LRVSLSRLRRVSQSVSSPEVQSVFLVARGQSVCLVSRRPVKFFCLRRNSLSVSSPGVQAVCLFSRGSVCLPRLQIVRQSVSSPGGQLVCLSRPRRARQSICHVTRRSVSQSVSSRPRVVSQSVMSPEDNSFGLNSGRLVSLSRLWVASQVVTSPSS
jgi:hypothetical protein